jgi:hypothetical protein
MADTATIASLATAGGTLVLAIATFASTRSANRSARIAERALDLNLRPVLIPAHEWDAAERVTFYDEIVQLRGGFATVEDRSGNLYFAAQLRNVGAGIGVLTAWQVEAGPDLPLTSDDALAVPDYSTFVAQQRSLYVPAGDVGYWQGAIREGDTDRGDAASLRRAIEGRERLTLHLRYGDQDGGHDTVTRYSLMPNKNGDCK